MASDAMSCSWVICEIVAIHQGQEHGSRGITIVESHYLAMLSEDMEDFMCAAVLWFLDGADP
jgi:hypothetical protein